MRNLLCFPMGMVLLCGVTILKTASSEEPLNTYHITMEQPSPYYTPVVASIQTGDRIQWDNKTPTVHTVTHDDCLTKQICIFDSGAVHPGQSFSLSNLPPGTYSYHCRLHPIMRGTLIVNSQKIGLKK